jgi:hypothetical protein
MKNRLPHKTFHFTVFLIASLLLSSQTFACLLPSPVEMRKDRSMACCTEHCRVETTAQVAQKACEQSQTAFSQDEAMAGPPSAMGKISIKDLHDIGLFSKLESWTSFPIPRACPASTYGTITSHQSVDLYILTRSLLI